MASPASHHHSHNKDDERYGEYSYNDRRQRIPAEIDSEQQPECDCELDRKYFVVHRLPARIRTNGFGSTDFDPDARAETYSQVSLCSAGTGYASCLSRERTTRDTN